MVPAMRYKQVRFIAHNIFTGPRVHPDGRMEYVGKSDVHDDIAGRVKLVDLMIHTALANIANHDPKDDLKIVMLPEFFFRGPTGAYDMDDVQHAVGHLQKIVKDPKWSDWLFVFGTILGKSYEAREAAPGGRMVIDTSKPVEVYNYTLVQKGGFGDAPNAGPAAAHAVIKEMMSGIDFVGKGNLANGGLALERVHHLAPAGTNRNEVERTSYDGRSIFKQDGLTFGLEICLDHLEGRLRNARNRPPIDIQLVPSCGASIKPRSVVARVGGYVFNCDGLNDAESEVQKVGDARHTITPQRLNMLRHHDSAIAPFFPHGAGIISLYPPQRLP